LGAETLLEEAFSTRSSG